VSHPVHSSAYPDIRAVFDQVLATGPVLQPFAGTPDEIRRAATRWRQRAYTFRARLRDELAARGQEPVTIYETIICRVTPEGVEVTTEAVGAALAPIPLGGKSPGQPVEVPTNVPDFAAIARQFGLDEEG